MVRTSFASFFAHRVFFAVLRRCLVFGGACCALCLFLTFRLSGIDTLGIKNTDAGIYLCLAKEWSEGVYAVSRWLRPGTYLLQGMVLRMAGHPLVSLKLLSVCFACLLYGWMGLAVFRFTRSRLYALAALLPLIANPFLIDYSRSEIPHFIAAFWTFAAFILLAGQRRRPGRGGVVLRFGCAGLLLGEGTACHDSVGPLAVSALLLIVVQFLLVEERRGLGARAGRAFLGSLCFCAGFWIVYGGYILFVGPTNALICLKGFIAAHHTWISNNTVYWGHPHIGESLRVADASIGLLRSGAISWSFPLLIIAVSYLAASACVRRKTAIQKQRLYGCLCMGVPPAQYIALLYAQRFWGPGDVVIVPRLLLNTLPLFYLFLVLPFFFVLRMFFAGLIRRPFARGRWPFSSRRSAAVAASLCFLSLGLNTCTPEVFRPPLSIHHWAYQQLADKVDKENLLIVCPWGGTQQANLLRHFAYFGEDVIYFPPLDPKSPYRDLCWWLSRQPVRYVLFYSRPIERRLQRLAGEFWELESPEEALQIYCRNQEEAYYRFFQRFEAPSIAEKGGAFIFQLPAPTNTLAYSTAEDEKKTPRQ